MSSIVQTDPPLLSVQTEKKGKCNNCGGISDYILSNIYIKNLREIMIDNNVFAHIHCCKIIHN